MKGFLDTRGMQHLAIGICGRCSLKYPIDELFSDPNFPGLKVCKKDLDVYDPWREPAPAPENIALMYARPDTELT